MAKNSIRDYSATNSSNTDIQSIDISEGCSPAGINNAIREVMADLKDVSTGAIALESPAMDSLSVTGTVTADGLTVSGDAVFTPDNDGVRITGANYATLRLEENDTTDLNTTMFNSGGKFSIFTSSDDRASATERVTLDHSTGNVGIADTSPVSLLTVNKGNVTGAGQWASSAIAIANPTNIGAYSQISFGYTAASNASAYIGYVSTNQGATGYGDLVFGTRSVNTNTQPSERMRIDSSGNVGIGTTSPSTSTTHMALRRSSLDRTQLVMGHSDTGNRTLVNFFGNGSQAGAINVSPTATSYATSSDYRLKTAVNYDWDATTRLKQLRPARFEWTADGDDAVPVDGFLAHEVQDIVPEAISGTKDAMRDEEYEVTPAVLDDDGNEVTPAVMGTRSVPDYQGIDQSKLTPLLTKALIEAVEKIEALEARITALETA